MQNVSKFRSSLHETDDYVVKVSFILYVNNNTFLQVKYINCGFNILDPCPTEGPIKSQLSICLSVCQFCMMVERWLEYVKTGRALFLRKIHFCPKLDKKAQNGPEIVSFFVLCKVL